MDKQLRKGILIIFIANIINVFFSLATNFLLPKYLTVESYAGIKTFQLYVSYVGLLHLGYVDGIYLKYGGKELTGDSLNSFFSNYSTLLNFQLAVTVVFLLLSILSKDIILTLFSLSILPQNMANFYKFLYQATGEFKLYGNVVNLTTISTFFVNFLLLFVFGIDNPLYYIALYVILYFIIWFYLDFRFKTNHSIPKGKRFDYKTLISNVSNGILLTLGNLASMLLTSMDRWFVKLLMNTLAFAQYSFAVSVENFLNIAITPVTTTLYNYFCREQDEKKHKLVLQYVIVFSAVLPMAAFPIRLILETFLTEYLESSFVLFLLFCAQMFYVVIKSVYVNLYKVQKRQRIYFRNLICILGIGFIFNCVIYYFWRTKEAFALGTLLSSIVWFLISSRDFKYLNISDKALLFLFSEMTVYLLCGRFLSAIVGCVVYAAISIILATILMHDALKEIIRVIEFVWLKKR